MKKAIITFVLLAICCVGVYSLLPGMNELLTPIVEEVSEESATAGAAAQKEPLTQKLEAATYEVMGLDIADANEELPTEDRQKREALGLTREGIEELMVSQQGLYAFDAMDVSQQPLYAEILAILLAREEEVVVSSVIPKDIDFVFQCVLNDHPEIFYVKGYVYTKHSMNDSILRISFSGTYTMEKPEIAKMQSAVEDYADTCIAGLPADADAYGKVKYIYEYLVSHTEYNLSAVENQNICSVFVYGESVCQGYAKAMQFLLNRLGIDTTLVIGYVDNGEGHAWNLVNIDGAFYYVDVTWGDAYYEFGETDEKKDNQDLPTINYDYLCVTTDQLCKTHTIENIVPMPRCISNEANYYVREGAYFTAYDSEKVAALFQKAYDTGNHYITLKCSSPEVYRNMDQILIKDQKVFDFIQNTEGTIAFTNSDEQQTISFWL